MRRALSLAPVVSLILACSFDGTGFSPTGSPSTGENTTTTSTSSAGTTSTSTTTVAPTSGGGGSDSQGTAMPVDPATSTATTAPPMTTEPATSTGPDTTTGSTTDVSTSSGSTTDDSTSTSTGSTTDDSTSTSTGSTTDDSTSTGSTGSTTTIGDNCGDGIVEPPEQCDGDDFGGKTCQTYGFGGGSLTCSTQCEMSTANCCKVLDIGCQKDSECCSGHCILWLCSPI